MHGLTLAGVLVEDGVSGSIPVEDARRRRAFR